MTKIGLVSDSNPFSDRFAWSGTIFKIRESVENAGFAVSWINYSPSSFWQKQYRRLTARIFRTRNIERSPFFYYLCAKSINRQQLSSVDVLFFVGSGQIYHYLKCKKPMIYLTDATFSCMLNYYWFINNKKIIKWGNKTEKNAIIDATKVIYSSDWARISAIKDYNCNPSKIEVIEFGPNINEKLLSSCKHYHTEDKLEILFVGVDWERKGAEIAINTVKNLNKKGINANLHICGFPSLPEEYGPTSEYIINEGFLNKNKPEDEVRLAALYCSCHIFLLPTKAECSGIVFCEASAYGLPIFTYDTGGLPNYVENGVNGYRLPPSSGPKEFADIIENCIQNGKLEKLSNEGKEIYRNKLNWSTWGQRTKKIISEVAASNKVQKSFMDTV